LSPERKRTEQFLLVSSVLTGFDEVDLHGTGMVDRYLAELVAVIGEEAADDVLSACAGIVTRHASNARRQASAIEREMLSSPRLGPVARNIIKMWYLGVWSRLPDTWERSGRRIAADVDRVISADAYVESLVWRAIDSHPPGARQPGFGSWAMPPQPTEDARRGPRARRLTPGPRGAAK